MASGGPASPGGRDLRCQHCGHGRFWHQEVRLDRPALGGLFHLEGAFGQQADVYACARCGFAHFFLAVPAEPDPPADAAKPPPAEPAPEEACLRCGRLIPSAAGKCPACGWTWTADGGGEG
jgi:DNA-directed RNA polymerase subunit RPC12/RpoP